MKNSIELCADKITQEIIINYCNTHCGSLISARNFVLTEESDPKRVLLNGQSFVMPLRLGEIIDYVNASKTLNNAPNNPEKIVFHNGVLDTKSSVYRKNSAAQDIKITEKELDILLYLFNKNEITPRHNLLLAVWGYNADIETHTLETHIYRLRQKIEDNPSTPKIILNNENGYKLGGY